MTLYMRVTPDRYELPVAVADSRHELARMLRLSYPAVWHGFADGNKRGLYVKVEVDEDDGER